MNWVKDDLNNERISECGRFKITRHKFSDTYAEFVLWERGKHNVRIATGRKRKPFDEMCLDDYFKILAQGTHKYVRDRANQLEAFGYHLKDNIEAENG